MSLSEFYNLYYDAININWFDVNNYNLELVKLFNNYDYIKIIWDWWKTNIVFSIKWKWCINSVIRWNYPWTEVFTSPNKFDVNWKIYINWENYFKRIWIVIWKLLFEFKNWKLINLEILWNNKRNWEFKSIINKKLDEKEWNRYLWEIAFWTNPNIPAWIKHKMIWEKAFWMHFALWKTFNFKNVDNWN